MLATSAWATKAVTIPARTTTMRRNASLWTLAMKDDVYDDSCAAFAFSASFASLETCNPRSGTAFAGEKAPCRIRISSLLFAAEIEFEVEAETADEAEAADSLPSLLRRLRCDFAWRLFILTTSMRDLPEDAEELAVPDRISFSPLEEDTLTSRNANSASGGASPEA